MATIFKTDELSNVSQMRKNSVEKVSTLSVVKPLPQSGDDLPRNQGQAAADEGQLKNAAGIMNEHVQQIHRQLQFNVDSDSGRIVIKVIDSDTDEVIRQIPGEEALELARKLAEGMDPEIFDSYA